MTTGDLPLEVRHAPWTGYDAESLRRALKNSRRPTEDTGRMGTTTERRLTAFGVTKTIGDWERDPRAAVYGELILRRLEAGMTPEQAVSTPVAAIEEGPTRYMAWGERKILRDWADDPRCRTAYANLRSRVEDDWAIEAAIETPTRSRTPRPVEAWGETKSLRAWSLDERAGASYGVILRRIEEGWDAERAIGEATEEILRVTAWGETKSCKAWGNDPRAAVNGLLILHRVRAGMAPEAAIATPGRETDRTIEAFGETKRLSEWLADPRCVVGRKVLRHRLGPYGWEAERALTEPLREAETTTAWGETRSLTEWARDPRARVDDALIRKRLREGMAPEAAISTPTPEVRRGDVEAWGEAKSLKGWAEDARCSVSADLIGSRLRGGLSAEEAISRPLVCTPTWVTAFGETRRLAEWAADPRCAVRRETLGNRLENGWEPETAISTPPAESNREGLTAFGEWRTLRAWAEDPRATVGEGAIAVRLARGMSPEEAITGDNRFAARLAAAAEAGTPGIARLVSAFGETKSLNAWSKDPRCEVASHVVGARLDRGMTPEEAIATVPERGVPLAIEAFGETRSAAEWGRDARAAVGEGTIAGRLRAGWAAEEAISTPAETAYAGLPREAFGESRTLREWSEDPRCTTPYGNLVSRLDRGMTLEEAMTAEAGVLRHGKFGERVEAFGEARTLGEWFRDPRRTVGTRLLAQRLRAGWGMEEAMTAPEGTVLHRSETKGTFVEAFGERKNIVGWSEDPRCRVSRWNLAQRLDAGWDAERAIAAPSGASAKSAGEHHWRKAQRTHVAFGETKSLPEWARDPRCAVSMNCLRQRLKDGVPVEEALTRLAKPRYEETPFRAFGTVKTLREWSEDGRCRVSYETLRQRIGTYGMTIELAIVTPVGDTQRIQAPKVRAFGERKTVVEWAADPRCAIAADTLGARLRSGWEAEAAIVKPSKRAA